MSYKTAKQLYDKGLSDREKFLEVARDNAAVTIPYIYPDTDHEEGEEFDNAYQSLGARGVNHLASQLLGVLFPTAQPFFRLSSDLGDEEDPTLVFRVDEALQKIERKILKDIDKRALRASLYNALRILIIGGTTVISSLDDSFRVLRLNQFVVKRHPDKKLKFVVYKDKITREKVMEIAPHLCENNKKEYFELYTIQYYNEDGSVKVCQEIEDERVVEEEFKKAPIFVVTSNILDEEDYGRSIVEELQGDLYTLERLSEAVSQSAAIASKHIFLVDPAGALRGRDLARANTGDVISGRATDVTVLQSQKGMDLNIVFQHIAELKDRLGKAFLMTAETFPDRQITATEARARVAEIEASLGGVYSQLSQTLQLPFLNLVIQMLEQDNKIPELPDGVTVNIITGLDLLDRKSKVTQIQEFITLVAGLGPEAIKLINPVAIVKEIAKGIGLDIDTFVVDPNEQQDPMEGMMRTQNQMLTSAADGAIQGVGSAAAGAVGQVTAEQAAESLRATDMPV